MTPFSVKNLKGYYSLSKHYEVNSTKQQGERGEVHRLWDKCRPVRLHEQWFHSSKAKRWEREQGKGGERKLLGCWTCRHRHHSLGL